MTHTARRTGDTIAIPGSYQFDALTHGNAVQRFWHHTKQLIVQQYLPPAPADYVLDVGCGSGVVSSFLAESEAEVLGIDGSQEAIAFAREKFQRPNLRFQAGLVDERFDAGDAVDKVYCLEVIEHIYFDQGHAMLDIFHSVLKPDGAVFLTTPNYHSLWPVIEWLMDRFKLAPQLADHQHVAHYHRRELRRLAQAAGFQVEAIVTTSLLAPWLAPLSWKLALHTHRLETGSFLPGSILAAVLRKK